MGERLFHRSVFIGLIMLLPSCYVTRLAFHQNNLINGRMTLKEASKDPKVDPKIKGKLSEVERILAFAKKSGLNTDNAYGYYVATGGDAVSYVVQAAHVDRLELVTWWFPVVGRVPYLGYFNRDERDEMAKSLEGQGYDVNLGDVGAFSSLGWFEDPIYEPMLRRNEADLAHLFFHELTHRTFWISGSVPFNENLAEFVGFKLTKNYLESEGKRQELDRYLNKQTDKIAFEKWLKSLKGELEDLYQSPHANVKPALLRRKQEIISFFLQEDKKPKFKVADYISPETWNNASILGASLYAPDLGRFEKAMACSGRGEVGKFLEYLKRIADEREDPFSALDEICIQSNRPGKPDESNGQGNNR